MKDALIIAERDARQPKLKRWLTRPFRYLIGLGLGYAVYPVMRKAIPVQCQSFLGDTLCIPLPAGLDIYLTGLKSHDSELRLAHFMIERLQKGMTALDVGAHLGYYSLLMSHCVESTGKVIAFEPSQSMFPFLKTNVSTVSHIHLEQIALGDDEATVEFYEYAPKYSEYNSLKHTHDIPIREIRNVQMQSLDQYCQGAGLKPDLIKIDVEGAEYEVLQGARKVMSSEHPVIIVELRKNAFDNLYAPVIDLMHSMGYRPCMINATGKLQGIEDVRGALFDSPLESDNIVFTVR